MKLSIKAGSTSQTVNVFVRDSSSTTGGGLTGLVYNSPSLTAYYALPKAAAVAITLATLAAVTSAYSSGGFKEIDATNMPGWYRLDVPDAALASGRFVSIHLKGATNMAPLPLEVELTATDNQSATAFITGVNGIAPPSNWNLTSIDSNGRVDVIKIAGTTQTARDIGASVLLSSGTGTGQLDITSGIAKVNVAQLLGTAWLTPGVAGTPDVNTKLIGGQTASASGTVTFPNATLASTANITAGTITTVTNLTNAATAGDLTSTMKTSVQTAVAAELDAAGSELSAIPSTTGSARQKLSFLHEYFRNKRTVTATTETLFKEDASTSLGTSTISDDGSTFTHGELN